MLACPLRGAGGTALLLLWVCAVALRPAGPLARRAVMPGAGNDAFGISEYYRAVPEIDQWLRPRVRRCYWKQWRLVRTKVRHLLALGVSKRQAMQMAQSSKSDWRLSKSPAIQVGMTNLWLKEQGLISVRALWMKAHGYA